MKGLSLLFSAAAAVLLIGCESELDTPTQDSIDESGFFAKFSPSDSILPFPNNLLFTDTLDGTLNIPTTDLAGGELDLVNALNSMNGFSTVAPISTTFSSAIDSTTLAIGTAVRVFEVTLNGSGVVTAVLNELDNTEVVATVSSVSGSDVNSPDPGANKLVISPLKPLKASTAYMVVLSNAIKGSNGDSAVSDTVYAFTKSTATLTTTSPVDATSLGEVKYSALLSTADADGNGTIDAGEATAALDSINSLEGLRQLTNLNEGAIETYTATNTPAITRSEMVLSWNFTTQSSGLSATHPLRIAKTNIVADPVHNVNSTALYTTTTVGGAGYADIHVGTLDVPYYLAADDDADFPLGDGPAKGFWENSGGAGSFTTPIDPTPVAQSTQTIPLLLSIPNATAPACVVAGDVPTCKGAGWPVVIFQHGITADRSSLLAIADSLAARGFAAVAIDLPMHGLLPTDATGLRTATAAYDTASAAGNLQERTFDVDYVDNTTGLAPGDTNIDTSGANYVNLPNMMTTRDNVYQSIADLFVLAKSLSESGAGTGLDYTGDTNGDFDPTKIYFVGHSLGGIVGASFLAIESIDADSVVIQDSVLAMPGGGIAKLLDGSASFGPVIEAGLGLSGVNKGTAEFETFLASAQMMIDAGDPINYASTIADVAYTQGILMFEVVGDGATNLSDLVVPNTVPDANDTSSTVPAVLSGTEPLITNMGLTQYNADDATTNLKAVVKFSAGHHSSLLKSTDANDELDATSAIVMTEMQTQAAQFLLTNGTLDVDDDTVLVAP